MLGALADHTAVPISMPVDHLAVATSWVLVPGRPGPFYLKAGSTLTGEMDDGETMARRDVCSQASAALRAGEAWDGQRLPASLHNRHEAPSLPASSPNGESPANSGSSHSINPPSRKSRSPLSTRLVRCHALQHGHRCWAISYYLPSAGMAGPSSDDRRIRNGLQGAGQPSASSDKMLPTMPGRS